MTRQTNRKKCRFKMKSFKPSSVAAQSRVLKSEIQSKHHLPSSPPMKTSTATLSVILVLSVVVQLAGGFNLSPQPNHVFKEPTLQTFREKVRSSYFGFALNLRPGGWVPPNNTWFIVGHAKWWASSGQTVELRLFFSVQDVRNLWLLSWGKSARPRIAGNAML